MFTYLQIFKYSLLVSFSRRNKIWRRRAGRGISRIIRRGLRDVPPVSVCSWTAKHAPDLGSSRAAVSTGNFSVSFGFYIEFIRSNWQGAIKKWRQLGGTGEGVGKSWRPNIGGRGLKPDVWDHSGRVADRLGEGGGGLGSQYRMLTSFFGWPLSEVYLLQVRKISWKLFRPQWF